MITLYSFASIKLSSIYQITFIQSNIIKRIIFPIIQRKQFNNLSIFHVFHFFFIELLTRNAKKRIEMDPFFFHPLFSIILYPFILNHFINIRSLYHNIIRIPYLFISLF